MVDPITIGVLGSLCIFALIFLGMHIAFAMMFVGFVGLAVLSSVDAAVSVTASTMWEVGSFYPYTVIPLFIIMGSFAGSSGITRELYSSFEKWTRRVPGGLAVATIGACGAFAAVSGSSVATAAAMGTVALPEMERFKYNPRLSTGSVAAGGTLGFLIPPSIGFVVYGMLTEQSIGKLLISGILPGILLTVSYAAVVVVWVKIWPDAAPRNLEPVSWTQKFRALKGVWEPLFIFFFAIGGIYAGFFTPDEAAAVGATLLLFITMIKRKLTWPALFTAMTEALRISVMVLMLVAGSECIQLLYGSVNYSRAGGQLGHQPPGLSVRSSRDDPVRIPRSGMLPRCHLHDGPDPASGLSDHSGVTFRPHLVRCHRGAHDGSRFDHAAHGT